MSDNAPAPDSAETARLLELAGRGDDDAVGALLDRHRGCLVRAVELHMPPRLRARVDPSDVVQEAQLAAYRRMSDYLQRRPMPFRLWLRRTAEEQLVALKRRHLGAARRDAGREEAWPDRSSLLLAQRLAAAGATPSHAVGVEEAAALVREALGRLSEDERQVLVMRNLESMSGPEVAQVLGIAPAAARQRYARALLQLRKRLAEVGLGGTGA